MMRPILASEKEAAVIALDLTVLYQKLTDPEERSGWDLIKCERIMEDYKKFHILMIRYPEKTIVPNKEIDTFWHAHILDTRKYYEDCIRCYGEFLHHYPYFGLNSAEDKKQLYEAFSETLELWNKEFKIIMQQNSTEPPRPRGCQANCAGRCKN